MRLFSASNINKIKTLDCFYPAKKTVAIDINDDIFNIDKLEKEDSIELRVGADVLEYKIDKIRRRPNHYTVLKGSNDKSVLILNIRSNIKRLSGNLVFNDREDEFVILHSTRYGYHYIENVETSVVEVQDEDELLDDLSCDSTPDSEQDEKKTIIRVLCVYTPAAKKWAGDEDEIEEIINSSIEKAQLISDNSNALVDFEIAGISEINYEEVSPSNGGKDLRNIYKINNGIADEVHHLRSITSADLVCIFADISNIGGAAYVSCTRRTSFAITRVQQSMATFTPAHEIFHLFGCRHHREQKIQPGPSDSYATGWRWLTKANIYNCSVMTYSSPSYFADGKPSTRVPYLSNPDILLDGIPIGVAEQSDNARYVREQRVKVSKFASSKDEIINIESSEVLSDLWGHQGSIKHYKISNLIDRIGVQVEFQNNVSEMYGSMTMYCKFGELPKFDDYDIKIDDCTGIHKISAIKGNDLYIRVYGSESYAGRGFSVVCYGFSGGSGTIENPYKISKINDLESISFFPNSHFILEDNIFLSNRIYKTSIVNDKNNSFTGTFNGNRHIIFDLLIAGLHGNNIALFSSSGRGASIYDVGLYNCNISGKNNISSFVASQNGGSVMGCFAYGKIQATGPAGGITAVNEDISKVGQCYFIGSVKGGYSVGGMTGINGRSCTVEESYFNGDISGNKDVGYICGKNIGAGGKQNNFWTKEGDSLVNRDLGFYKQDNDFRDFSKFIEMGWSFGEDWLISADTTIYNGFPIFYWQDVDKKGPYYVKFKMFNDIFIQTGYIGDKVEYPEPKKVDGYSFIKWSLNVDTIQDNCVVIAIYEQKNKFLYNAKLIIKKIISFLKGIYGKKNNE